MTSIAGAIVMFEVLEVKRIYGDELGAVIGAIDGKQRWLREKHLALIGMAAKTKLCVPRFQS